MTKRLTRREKFKMALRDARNPSCGAARWRQIAADYPKLLRGVTERFEEGRAFEFHGLLLFGTGRFRHPVEWPGLRRFIGMRLQGMTPADLHIPVKIDFDIP